MIKIDVYLHKKALLAEKNIKKAKILMEVGQGLACTTDGINSTIWDLGSNQHTRIWVHFVIGLYTSWSLFDSCGYSQLDWRGFRKCLLVFRCVRWGSRAWIWALDSIFGTGNPGAGSEEKCVRLWEVLHARPDFKRSGLWNIVTIRDSTLHGLEMRQYKALNVLLQWFLHYLNVCSLFNKCLAL